VAFRKEGEKERSENDRSLVPSSGVEETKGGGACEYGSKGEKPGDCVWTEREALLKRGTEETGLKNREGKSSCTVLSRDLERVIP